MAKRSISIPKVVRLSSAVDLNTVIGDIYFNPKSGSIKFV